MVGELVDLLTEHEGLGALLQAQGDSLEGEPEFRVDDAEAPSVYFLHNVLWESLRDWLDARHMLLNGDLEYEVRGTDSDRLVRSYARGQCYEGPDPLERIWGALRKEIEECAVRVNLPI